MKNIYSLSLIAILLISCGDKSTGNIDDVIASKDKSLIEQKRNELKQSQQSINSDLLKIEAELSKLNGKKNLPIVTALTVQESEFNHYLEIQGSVKTKEDIILFAQFAGTLSNVYVKEGQKVNKGQILARIDDGGLSQQLSQAKISEELARTTFERQKRLWDQKIGSELQFLQAEATFQGQQNLVKQLESQLSKTYIKAPFKGVVDDVISEQGSVVAPGQSQIIHIVNLDNMYIEAEIPESHLQNITKGKKVEVNFPVLDKTIETSVRQVGNFINPSNRAFRIEVGVPNFGGEIKPNLMSKLKINDYTNQNAYMIPQSIISENGGGNQYVFVVDNVDENNIGKAKKTIIKTGQTQGDLIEVLTGLSSS